MSKTSRVILSILITAIIIAAIYAVGRSRNGGQTTAGKLIDTMTFSCNGGNSITAAFYQGEGKAGSTSTPPVPGGNVVLSLNDGRSAVLSQTISADGARYANNDESYIFWAKGNTALFLEDNQEKSYTGCLKVASEPAGSSLPNIYANTSDGFSIRLPAGFTVDRSYAYQALGPGSDIPGVKFEIPAQTATGTNLSKDTYISVERIHRAGECSAAPFVSPGATVRTMNEGDVTYSVATSSGAGLGNRYEETVFALPGTSPCTAVRYFIHYTVVENYPPGTVKEFDKDGLLRQFDNIRRTLVILP